MERRFIRAAALTGVVLFLSAATVRGSENPSPPSSPEKTPTPPASLFDPSRLFPFSQSPRLEITADYATEPMRIVTQTPEATQTRPFVEPTETEMEESARRKGNRGNSDRRNDNDSKNNSDKNETLTDPVRCIAIPGGCDPRTPKPRTEPTPNRCIQNFPNTCGTPQTRPR